jgi:hypothetical protein
VTDCVIPPRHGLDHDFSRRAHRGFPRLRQPAGTGSRGRGIELACGLRLSPQTTGWERSTSLPSGMLESHRLDPTRDPRAGARAREEIAVVIRLSVGLPDDAARVRGTRRS